MPCVRGQPALYTCCSKAYDMEMQNITRQQFALLQPSSTIITYNNMWRRKRSPIVSSIAKMFLRGLILPFRRLSCSPKQAVSSPNVFRCLRIRLSLHRLCKDFSLYAAQCVEGIPFVLWLGRLPRSTSDTVQAANSQSSSCQG